MPTTVTPMIHVPDVAATAAWYERLGFTIVETASDGPETTWVLLTLGGNAVMLNCGGRPSGHDRREVDLYAGVDDVGAWRDRLPDGIDMVEDVHDTFYGMREFIIRDLNGFWITVGERAA